MAASFQYETIILARDVKATEVPSGTPMIFPAGHEVTVMQALGGHFTVVTHQGQMARIAREDADALGAKFAAMAAEVEQAKAKATAAAPAAGAPTREALFEAMKQVYDPEIPVNVVDLGLIYACDITPRPEGGYRVDVKMSMTAPGCGMGDVLKGDVERLVADVPGVGEVHAEVVWEPPWDRAMMSDAAKLQLGMY